jgi:hypothetical protein
VDALHRTLWHCKTDAQRQFFIEMARKFGWTTIVLAMQIENQTFESR